MPEHQPTPAERLEQLTSLYERQAYVVWNVSQRTTLEGERAVDAARRAFLGQVEAPDEPRLAADAARLAAELSQPVDPRALEDPVLAASAGLAAVQRAVIALGELAGGAGAFGLDESAEEEVRRRGLEQLATLLGVSAAEAEEAYADLPWEEPPGELWQTLYPELHAAVTKHARAAQTEAAASESEPARRRSWVVPRIPRAALVPVALLAIAGVAWAASGGGSGSDSGVTPSGAGAAPSALGGSGGSSYASDTNESGDAAPALTAEQLDRLRQEEIEDLKRFTARKSDRSLPRRERRQAARRVNDLVKLAQARQRAAERRELALRQELARERAARMREAARRREAREEERQQEEERVPTPAPAPSPQEPERDKPQSGDKRDDETGTRDETQAECLYDEGSGAYICPE